MGSSRQGPTSRCGHGLRLVLDAPGAAFGRVSTYRRLAACLPARLSHQPAFQPFMDLGTRQQIEMPRATHQCLMVPGKGEAAVRVAVLPECAVDGHEAVAQQPRLQAFGRRPQARGDRVAAGAAWQRYLVM